ncbi:hypothetical protein BDV32DRAFT_122660 [Aspergillus pseudonomiae]|nr:hypothetical protein BDV32DRAFT_122660 [Aspergillus pseudonomiae]
MEEVRKESLAELTKGPWANVNAAMLVAGFWGSDYGCNFSIHLDNVLLDAKEMSEAELRMLVESFLCSSIAALIAVSN